MFTICSRHRPSRRSPGRRSDGPGQGPVKPESAGFGPIPGKTRGFLADTRLRFPPPRLPCTTTGQSLNPSGIWKSPA